MNLRLLLSILIIAGLLTAATSAKAELADADPPTDDEVNAIAKKLYCPVCPNTPLDVCETKACQDWRAQIRDQLASGWTEDQIIEYFVEQYGERVLAEPRMSGFTAIVWLSPLESPSLRGSGRGRSVSGGSFSCASPHRSRA
jgi:cytochrome c-type biogenesis protein CcmH